MSQNLADMQQIKKYSNYNGIGLHTFDSHVGGLIADAKTHMVSGQYAIRISFHLGG